MIDTDATHSYLSEEFLSSCGLNVEMMPNVAMCVNTPLGSSSMTTRVVKSVDVVVEGLHMPTDMLVLSMSDFDVILGMNWLNHYGVIIDCQGATLSFELDGRSIKHELCAKVLDLCHLWSCGKSLS